ncbi:STM3941 family protein [Flavobacterium aquicola]|uniref:PH (Pleckstrin Homology) domain-containing protein n=1 Tax=Flavobacterium aquicola TaxID=1682742 RepID=A0A3E0ENC5_9FLAO|nr:STM3941 family protein [Flavobacterium aquicola]REG99671.1 hypothetical protein C8P67_104301 [Flavobacterium aquicola]
MNKMEFKSSRKKIYFSIIGCIIFTSAFIPLYLYPTYFISPIFRNIFFIKIVGLIGFLLFGWVTLVLIIKEYENKISLTVDDFGILDNSNLVKTGLIEWEDIEEIKTNNRLILINVNNPEKYIEKAESKFQAFLMKSNTKIYGTPITVSSSLLNCDLNKLEKILKEEFEKHNSDRSNITI